MKKEQIKIQDIEFIEYYPRNSLDIGKDYWIIGSPALIKKKEKDDIKKRFKIELSDVGKLIDNETKTILATHSIADELTPLCDLLNEFYDEISKLEEKNKKTITLIDEYIEAETHIAEKIESTIEEDYACAINRLTIDVLKNLKRELEE